MFWRELNIDTIPKQSTCKILTYYHEKKKNHTMVIRNQYARKNVSGLIEKQLLLSLLCTLPLPSGKNKITTTLKKH